MSCGAKNTIQQVEEGETKRYNLVDPNWRMSKQTLGAKHSIVRTNTSVGAPMEVLGRMHGLNKVEHGSWRMCLQS